jgi:hypothetical protein
MKRNLLNIVSLLLLLIFSVIQVLPALHHHSEADTAYQKSFSKQNSSKHSLNKHSADCLICDFVANKQLDYPSDLSAVTVHLFAGKPVTLNADYCQQLFETAVHTWTNKGPPSILS